MSMTRKPAPARYATDPEYQKRKRKLARDAYRRKAGGEFELVTCLRSLQTFEPQAEHMTVCYKKDSQAFQAPVYRIPAVAEFCDMSYQALNRLISNGMIPEPSLYYLYGTRQVRVYHREELRQILTILGEQKKRFRYYRKEHTDTQNALYDAFEKLHAIWEKEKPWQNDPSVPPPPNPPRPAKRIPSTKPLRRKPK